MRNLFFCRDRRPRLSALRVGTSVCTQNKFPTIGSEATVSLPLTGEVARNARRRGLTAPKFRTNSRPCTGLIFHGRVRALCVTQTVSSSRKSAQTPLLARTPFPTFGSEATVRLPPGGRDALRKYAGGIFLANAGSKLCLRPGPKAPP